MAHIDTPEPNSPLAATCHAALARAALDGTHLYLSRLPADLVAQVDRYIAVAVWMYGGQMKMLAHPKGSADVRLVLANGEDALLLLEHMGDNELVDVTVWRIDLPEGDARRLRRVPGKFQAIAPQPIANGANDPMFLLVDSNAVTFSLWNINCEKVATVEAPLLTSSLEYVVRGGVWLRGKSGFYCLPSLSPHFPTPADLTKQGEPRYWEIYGQEGHEKLAAAYGISDGVGHLCVYDLRTGTEERVFKRVDLRNWGPYPEHDIVLAASTSPFKQVSIFSLSTGALLTSTQRIRGTSQWWVAGTGGPNHHRLYFRSAPGNDVHYWDASDPKHIHLWHMSTSETPGAANEAVGSKGTVSKPEPSMSARHIGPECGEFEGAEGNPTLGFHCWQTGQSALVPKKDINELLSLDNMQLHSDTFFCTFFDSTDKTYHTYAIPAGRGLVHPRQLAVGCSNSLLMPFRSSVHPPVITSSGETGTERIFAFPKPGLVI